MQQEKLKLVFVKSANLKFRKNFCFQKIVLLCAGFFSAARMPQYPHKTLLLAQGPQHHG